jgi:hypothetical protein
LFAHSEAEQLIVREYRGFSFAGPRLEEHSHGRLHGVSDASF